MSALEMQLVIEGYRVMVSALQTTIDLCDVKIKEQNATIETLRETIGNKNDLIDRKQRTIDAFDSMMKDPYLEKEE